MARAPRIYNKNTKVYHIILRGLDQQEIFFDEKDRVKFLKELENTKQKYDYEMYVYCLMSNHVHMVIYDKNDQISTIMQSLAIRYSSYFNKKYERNGHLFQNRFLSKRIEDKGYLLNVCRYIHQNPQKACIDKMEEYQWSSYQEYVNQEKWIVSNALLSVFSDDLQEAKKQFVLFHQLIPVDNDGTEAIDYEMNTRLTDEQLIKYIQKRVELPVLRQKIKGSQKERQEVLQDLRQIKGTSYAQLARVLGVNRKIVERALKQNDKILV